MQHWNLLLNQGKIAPSTSSVILQPIFLFFNVSRIGFDGKLTLEKRLKGIYITGQKLEETRKKLLDAGKAVPFKYVCFKFT